EVQQSEAHLFKNRTATEWLTIQPQNNGGQLAFMGQNPSKNAVINYYLGSGPSGELKFEVSSADGANSCTATVADAKPGIGRMEWTMRWTQQPGQGGGRGGRGGGGRGGGGGAGAGAGGAGAAQPPSGAAVAAPGAETIQGPGRGNFGGGAPAP